MASAPSRAVSRALRKMNSDLDELFERLARSSFRRRFRLHAAEKDYLERKGLDTVMEHGEKFIEERLAPANPLNDGRQTPMRNHPDLRRAACDRSLLCVVISDNYISPPCCLIRRCHPVATAYGMGWDVDLMLFSQGRSVLRIATTLTRRCSNHRS